MRMAQVAERAVLSPERHEDLLETGALPAPAPVLVLACGRGSTKSSGDS